MTRAALITINFTDWWLSGTGRAGSGDVDAVPHRDRYGCPALPMSQIKGQLRESAARLAQSHLSGWDDKVLRKLFGWKPKIPGEPPPVGPGESLEAALAFQGDATLDEPTARRLSQSPMALAQLSRRRSATKVDGLGVAADDTLRALEAAVPLTLIGKVRWIAEADPDCDWVNLLDAACAATLAFGKLKTDGYGRAIARCK